MFGLLKSVIWLAILAVALHFGGAEAARFFLQKYGSEAAGADVTISRVTPHWLSQSISLSGISVANPKGFNNPYLMTIQKMTIQPAWSTLNKDVITLQKIEITEPKFITEQNQHGNNLKKFLDNLKVQASEEQAAITAEKMQLAGSEEAVNDFDAPQKQKIAELSITKAQAGIILSLGDKTTHAEYINLGNVHRTNLGGENGGTPAEILVDIFEPLIGNATRSGLRLLAKHGGLDAKVESIVEDVKDGIKKLFINR